MSNVHTAVAPPPWAEGPALAVRPLHAAERRPFVRLMTAACALDPLFLDIFGEDRRLPVAAHWRAVFFAFLFDRGRIAGHTLRGAFDAKGKLVACYLLEDSAHTDPLLRVLWRFLQLLPRIPWRSSRLLNTYVRRTRRVAPPQRHHYLTMIGVLPDQQGRGVGNALLHEVIATARQTPGVQAVVLDTDNPVNVPRYEKLGFRTTQQVQVGRTAVHCMVLTL